MYLLVFDIIDSKLSNTQIIDVIDDQQINRLINKYTISSDYIEIAGGDQLRILCTDYSVIMSLILEVYHLLAIGGLKSRLFITNGSVSNRGKINTMTGSLFFKNKHLEEKVKEYNKTKDNYIAYDGNMRTQELNLLFNTFSKLCLKKVRYINTLYLYLIENKTQSEIAEFLDIKQPSVNNQLKSANKDIAKDYIQVITKLLQEELCK